MEWTFLPRWNFPFIEKGKRFARYSIKALQSLSINKKTVVVTRRSFSPIEIALARFESWLVISFNASYHSICFLSSIATKKIDKASVGWEWNFTLRFCVNLSARYLTQRAHVLNSHGKAFERKDEREMMSQSEERFSAISVWRVVKLSYRFFG